ncbi:MAG: hypothetical protein R2771_13750 [Saprospiraceae bacterium]
MDSYLQYIGYAASIIIAISMAINSILIFRWVNLIGALIFSIYGFIIGAIPVGILNALIVIVDFYYILRIYFQHEQFDTLEIKPDNKYLKRFLKFYKKEIGKYFPNFKYELGQNSISFFVLRNMNVAGVFLANHIDENTIMVDLDFVIPEYRDFKNGIYIYNNLVDHFINLGYTRILSSGDSREYSNYLKKIGFKKIENGLYEKILSL